MKRLPIFLAVDKRTCFFYNFICQKVRINYIICTIYIYTNQYYSPAKTSSLNKNSAMKNNSEDIHHRFVYKLHSYLAYKIGLGSKHNIMITILSQKSITHNELYLHMLYNYYFIIAKYHTKHFFSKLFIVSLLHSALFQK